MKAIGCSIVALFVGLVSSAGADEAKDALKKLEGTWKVVSIEAVGLKVEAGKGAPDTIVIKDGKATFYAKGKAMPTFKDVELRVDAGKKPATVDFIRGKKETLPGIYELNRNDLKLALPMVPSKRKPDEKLQRPQSFDTKDKPFLVLIARRSQK